MEGKKELIMLILSTGLFVFDLGSDCYLAYHYKRAGDDAWFGWTLVFIILPLLITSMVAIRQMKYRGFSFITFCFYSTVFIFVRFKKEFCQWKRTYWENSPCGKYEQECNCTKCEQHREVLRECKKSAYQFAWIRYVEAYLESTPQLLLQVYIMLKKWSFPWYTVLSATVSLLALAWSNTALEKARLSKDGHDFNKKATVLHFVSQLLVLMPRLFAIVIIMHASIVLAVVILLFTWLAETFVLACVTGCHTLSNVCCGDTQCSDPSIKTLCGRLTLTLLLTFYVSETVLESLGFHSIFIKIFFFFAKSAENGVMTYMSMYNLNSRDRSYLTVPLAWSFFAAGVFFGALLLIIRHILKRREEAVPQHDV